MNSYCKKNNTHTNTIAVVGLGYVGYPLFCSISQYFECWGMDIDKKRIETLSMNKKTIRNNQNIDYIEHDLE